MLDQFEKAAAFTMVYEGGDKVSDNANDPGGLTKYGISQRAYPQLDIKALTEQQALDIYRADYWNKIQGDKLPWPVNLVLFDYAFNSGVMRATLDLQSLFNIRNDGWIGPATLAKVEAAKPWELARDLCAKRLEFLGNLSGWKAFGLGWSRRVLALQDLVSKSEIWIAITQENAAKTS